ncbi:hypothetical protein [Hydrogenophaga laconesensis]|uniref:Uncharacterized protein n=1 Tax=Hydrogenophaga laconesensis TaxID=1805971 RepID=A0ABU1V9L5_9BURK|nr:hypothetical protein [Hydrogenophaga laconesensis]MDR7094125.1 hypothetical protein [Hydrogenophaga laconesensis]
MNPSSEREAFEAWDSAQYEIDAQVYAHKRNDRYVDRPVQGRWEAWQARAALSTQPQQATADLRNWGALVFPAMDQAAKTLATVECADLHEQQMMDELIEKLKSLSIQYATIVRPLPPVPGQEGVA